jgi:hypothetical protein
MAKKADNSSPFTLGMILKSGVIINIFYLFIVLLLIKMIDGFVDGFSNPQVLQREYYYFYPELFEELPESIENDMSGDSLDGVNNNQPMWMASSEEDLGIMGTEETDTPYLMEELYLVQDDMRDVRSRLDVIANEVGVQQPDGATCSEYTTNDIPDTMTHPCNIITDSAECGRSEYCQYNVDSASPSGGNCEVLMDDNSQPVEIDCTEEYNANGGLIRYSCPWVCQYKNNVESPKVQGGFLLTDSNRLL